MKLVNQQQLHQLSISATSLKQKISDEDLQQKRFKECLELIYYGKESCSSQALKLKTDKLD